jgi:hypothetical protein
VDNRGLSGGMSLGLDESDKNMLPAEVSEFINND